MKLVALDLDGTLEDSRRDMVEAVVRVRARLGLPPRDPARILPWVSRGMANLYAHAFDEVDADTARAAYTQDYAEHIATHTRVYPGVRSALEALEAQASLAVVTNKPEALSEALLDALDLRRFFAAVVGGDSCEEAKPSPLMIAEAVRRAGTDGPVSMVGDSAGDVRMGHAAGARTVWCAWGYASSPAPEVPDAIAWSPEALPALV